MPKGFEYIAVGLSAIALCWGITEIFRRWALRRNLLDFTNERSSHTRPTPRGGGIGIVITILIGGLGIFVAFASEGTDRSFSFAQIGLIAFGAISIAAISWMDDTRKGLSPKVRVIIHLVAAGLALIVLGGWNRMALPFIGTIELGWGGIPVVLLWIVGLVNVYNFMDGIDGIAGVQAITAAAGWIAVGIISKNEYLSAFGVLIGTAAIGFLIHNWPPAKIFLGDIGSAFLGFTFAILPLLAKLYFMDSIGERLPIAGTLMVAPFVADASFTLMRRIIRKEKLSQAHRSHLYQRLVLSGIGHREVTLLYFALGILGSIAGTGYLLLPNRFISSILAVSSTVIVFIIPFVFVTVCERRLKDLKISH